MIIKTDKVEGFRAFRTKNWELSFYGSQWRMFQLDRRYHKRTFSGGSTVRELWYFALWHWGNDGEGYNEIG